jgi:hypothetical protein
METTGFVCSESLISEIFVGYASDSPIGKDLALQKQKGNTNLFVGL